jgi:hypothetical protein
VGGTLQRVTAASRREARGGVGACSVLSFGFQMTVTTAYDN